MPEAPNETQSELPPAGPTLEEKNKNSLDFIEKVTSDPDGFQRGLLADILSRNSGVEYLRRYGLNGRTDRESFKKIIPVIKYEDISDDINRIANGDSSQILSSSPISEFLTSSGTSGGERKLMPTIAEEMDRRTLLYSLLMPVMSQHVPGLESGKGMYFLFIKSEAKTPSGLFISSISDGVGFQAKRRKRTAVGEEGGWGKRSWGLRLSVIIKAFLLISRNSNSLTGRGA